MMKIGEGQQSAQRFLSRQRLEYSIPFLQWKGSVGAGRFPVNAGWIGTHAGLRRERKLLSNGI